jgi:molybdate transport system substrate-binding protein
MRLWVTALLLACCLPGCADPDRRADGSLLVFAASDLEPVLPGIARAFTDEHGTPVDIVFGSSGMLAAQIRNGAPAHVFLSADERFVDPLVTANVLAADSRTGYALGRLAIVHRPDLPPPSALVDLADPGYEVIAIANPDHAPYGRAAREALVAAAVWPNVAGRVVQAGSVAQAFQLLQAGSADAAVVALSLAIARGDAEPVRVPAHLHAPLSQTGGVVAGTGMEEIGRAFLRFLAGDRSRAALEEFGFERPRRE